MPERLMPGRQWIAQHLPHQGRMCLLDEVLDWDELRVRCRAGNHRAPDHPLRAHGRLGVACGIEYAAQAMAVHGALLGAAAAGTRAGLLAGVRDVRFEVSRLDDVAGDLICEATRIAAGGGMALYGFAVHGTSALLLRGRASVVFEDSGSS